MGETLSTYCIWWRYLANRLFTIRHVTAEQRQRFLKRTVRAASDMRLVYLS